MSVFDAVLTNVDLEPPARISGVDEREAGTVRALWAVWGRKFQRNMVRSSYYEAKVPVENLFISTPDDVASRIKAVLGWPAKAVNTLADRTIFEGFVSDGNETDPFELGEVLNRNVFEMEFSQAVRSAYTHSCAFITVIDDPELGVQVLARSAEMSAALWDRRRREIAAMMSVIEVNGDGAPVLVDVFLPEVTLRLTKGAGVWRAERLPNRFGHVMAEPIVFDPTMRRPFGRSRISRPVMAITDNAMRTIVRSEVSAEFYTAPRMVVLGASEDAFSKGKWNLAIERWAGFTRDEDGELPSVQQLPQMTMQPLIDQYRAYAAQFAAETDLPISSLGIVQDNPPSAEAMYAAEKDLITRARAANRVHANSLRRLAWKILAARDGLAELPREAYTIDAKFTNPAFVSPVTAADALTKLSAVFPWLAESEVALEYAGFSRAEITRLLGEKKRAEGRALFSDVLAQVKKEADNGRPVSDGGLPAGEPPLGEGVTL